MVTLGQLIASVVIALIGSSGFWAYVNSKTQNKSAMARMLKGIGHDRICFLGEKYLNQGLLSKDEFENLYDYLYLPYKELGGNGTAEKIIDDVKRLPIKEKE